MFTGLVESVGAIVDVRETFPGRTLAVRDPVASELCQIGDSVAVNGCCLTVVRREGDSFEFEAGPETLKRTNLGLLRPGSSVNLERSLRVGDRLGGHFVTGHIDGQGTLDERIDEADWSTFWIRVPPTLITQMASKGSVAVDGVSLTLVDVEESRFSVALIPHTLKQTTLGELRPGDGVNIETDLLAKYVHQILNCRTLRV